MKFNNAKVEDIYEYMSRASRKAYSDPYLIVNDVLCKQDTQGFVLERCVLGDTPQKVTFLFAAKKVILYFLKNLAAYLLYIVTALAHRLSRQSCRLPEKGELVILDIYCRVRETLDFGKFSDSFFPDLVDALERRKLKYVYVPRFFGSMQPLQFYRVFRIFKKNGDSVLTEFQLLNLADYFEIVRFIFFYPISVLRFAKNLGNTYEDEVLRRGVWESLDGIAFGGYVRFLLGKRLSFIKINKIKCLSWYENQVLDKNFYRGLRITPNKVKIIGAQLFVRPFTLLNILPDEFEAPFNVIPDKVLVNGAAYIFKSRYTQVDIGPSLRYAHIFNLKVNPSNGKIILVLMPYWDYVIRHILKIIREVGWQMPVKIKFHPSTDGQKYCQELDEFSVTNKPIPELLSEAMIVLGNGTGSLVEAIALGIPVINIQSPSEFSHNYMPEEGKGVLWDQAVEAKEVTRLVSRFQNFLESDPSRLKKEGEQIKSNFFSAPTDKLIGQAFQLD